MVLVLAAIFAPLIAPLFARRNGRRRHSGGAVRRTPLRHRRIRARHVQPGHLRRAADDPGRRHRGGHLPDDRPPDRARLGLCRRLDRTHPDARRRRPLLVYRNADRACRRRRARAEPHQCDDRRRHCGDPVLRTRRLQRHAGRVQPALYRGGDGGRCRPRPAALPPSAAERHSADDRRRHARRVDGRACGGRA